MDYEAKCGCEFLDFYNDAMIKHCPLHAAAQDYDDLLERFTTYIQTKLLPGIRSIEGGQVVIDGAWNLVAEAHGLRKRTLATTGGGTE